MRTKNYLMSDSKRSEKAGRVGRLKLEEDETVNLVNDAFQLHGSAMTTKQHDRMMTEASRIWAELMSKAERAQPQISFIFFKSAGLPAGRAGK